MEERLPTLHITEKYMVLVVAVRLLMKANIKSVEEAQRILEFSAIQAEPFHYAKLYANLIQEILNTKASEFINKFLCDAESMATYYYDNNIVAYFRELHNCQDDMRDMLIKIETQLMSMAHLESGDSYDSHGEKAIIFMCDNKILNGIRVFKDESGLVNKSMLFLDTRMAILAKDTDEMDRLSFRL